MTVNMDRGARETRRLLGEQAQHSDYFYVDSLCYRCLE